MRARLTEMRGDVGSGGGGESHDAAGVRLLPDCARD